jgi:dCTP deaminase
MSEVPNGMIEPFEPGPGQVFRWERRRQRPAHRQLRHVELRLRRALRATSSRSSPTSTRRSSTRRTSIRRSSTSKSDVCIIPPNSFALARTVEYFRIPRDVLVVCLGKSTYARCGIIVNVTPLEPEWEGHVTLEFSNTTPLPAKIYAGEGVAQMLFFESDEVCETSYRDRGGKYQGQTGVTLPKT